MGDSSAPSVKNRKKIMFYDSPDRQTKLRIRCQFDEITQSQFFRMMVTGYINNDELIHSFITRYKKDNQIQGKSKRAKINKIRKSTAEIEKKFSINENEIENIFDTIEQETGL